MRKKQIQPGEKVPLKLTATERKLILKDLMCLDEDYERIIREAPTGKPVMMTLDDLDDFGGYVAAESNHCGDKKKEKRLDTVFEKIQRLLDTYTDEDNSTISIEQARGKIANATEDALASKNPGIVSFPLPGTQQRQAEKFPIKITALQWEAVVACTRLNEAIKHKLKEVEKGTQVIEFTRKELDDMENELSQAAMFARSPYKQRVVALQKKVHEIVDRARLVEFGIGQPTKRRRPSSTSKFLFQFKIMLLEISPSIWRRIQVSDCTLLEMHDHIQAAFGWCDYHMHQFEIDGRHYGPSALDDLDFGLDMLDESDVLLSQLLPRSGKRARWMYEYDFGDGWRHEIVFEGYPPTDKKMKYPLCVEGERACPPEDVGGPWGYADYLEAIADPDHERHEEFMEWRGPCDPDEFDAKKATREMREK